MNLRDLKKTGLYDKTGLEIKEGDILIGKTDQLNSEYGEPGLYERDYVTRHREIHNPLIDPRLTQGWFWNGHKLDSVARNMKIIGNILVNPEMLLIQ